jgi:hypothetical protein
MKKKKSDLARAFIKTLGKPSPAAASGLHFRDDLKAELWEDIYQEIGAGWFLDRFVYLFGVGLEAAKACLDAWSFCVPPAGYDRVILGRNAHGALLVMEDQPNGYESIHILDPLHVTWWSEPQIAFVNLLGAWLPEKRLPHFLDDSVYRKLVARHGALPDGFIFAPITPLGLGGTHSPDNYQPEELITYYTTTGPIYARAKKGKK